MEVILHKHGGYFNGQIVQLVQTFMFKIRLCNLTPMFSKMKSTKSTAYKEVPITHYNGFNGKKVDTKSKMTSENGDNKAMFVADEDDDESVCDSDVPDINLYTVTLLHLVDGTYTMRTEMFKHFNEEGALGMFYMKVMKKDLRLRPWILWYLETNAKWSVSDFFDGMDQWSKGFLAIDVVQHQLDLPDINLDVEQEVADDLRRLKKISNSEQITFPGQDCQDEVEDDDVSYAEESGDDSDYEDEESEDELDVLEKELDDQRKRKKGIPIQQQNMKRQKTFVADEDE